MPSQRLTPSLAANDFARKELIIQHRDPLEICLRSQIIVNWCSSPRIPQSGGFLFVTHPQFARDSGTDLTSTHVSPEMAPTCFLLLGCAVSDQFTGSQESRWTLPILRSATWGSSDPSG
jgi:hypothetical protein